MILKTAHSHPGLDDPYILLQHPDDDPEGYQGFRRDITGPLTAGTGNGNTPWKVKTTGLAVISY